MKKIAINLLAAILLLSFSRHKDKSGFGLNEFEKNLVFIPTGSYTQYDDELDRSPRSVSVSSFYMHKYEVSNFDYLQFLYDLKQHDTSLYRKMLPDTLVWRDKLSYCEPYVDYYFRHPAYRTYPMVGVTHEQALQFCKWLTDKYAKEEKRKYKNAVFKLPTKEQWAYAAHGGKQEAVFPWGGPYMQNKKGEWLANFRVIDQSNIGWVTLPVKNAEGKIEDRKLLLAGPGKPSMSYNGWSYDYADITAPVTSFYPNDLGLHNMAGNVEEYVAEKGITKGGSWKDTGYYLMNSVEETYDSLNSVSSERGFRFIMELAK